MTFRKFRNKPTEVDGIRFDSKKEARRYSELALLAKSGVIADLERQVSHCLLVNGDVIGTYRSDFEYFDRERNKHVVEDVKGVITPVYRMKKKLMKALYGIEIQEV